LLEADALKRASQDAAADCARGQASPAAPAHRFARLPVLTESCMAVISFVAVAASCGGPGTKRARPDLSAIVQPGYDLPMTTGL